MKDSNQNQPRIRTKHQPTINQKSSQSRPKVIPKSTKNRPKIDPKSSQNRPQIGSGTDLASEIALGSILTPFWSQLGAILGAKIGPCWGQVAPKIDFLRLKKALKNDHDVQHLCKAVWGRCWDDLGSQHQSQIVPKSVPKGSSKAFKIRSVF